jgi:hypothetical protein
MKDFRISQRTSDPMGSIPCCDISAVADRTQDTASQDAQILDLSQETMVFYPGTQHRRMGSSMRRVVQWLDMAQVS